MTLGQKLKELRSQEGLTQKDLAEKLHVSFQTVSKWENGENEPDINTLKELAILFDCSVGYLVGSEQDNTPSNLHFAQESEPVIVPQKNLHICARCKKEIPEDDLAMEDICVKRGNRRRPSEFRKAYYHTHCLDKVHEERKEEALRKRALKEAKAKKWSFGWGIAGGVVALIISLLILLLVPEIKAVLHPAASIGISIGISYAIFAAIYCIISGSYIGEVFLWSAGLSIKFPGLIFSWSIEGFAWLIMMKILFAILGFLIGIFTFCFALFLSGLLSAVSFPFILVHNNRTYYEDSLID